MKFISLIGIQEDLQTSRGPRINNDAHEMQNFYRQYFQKDIQPFQNSEEAYRTLYLTKAYQIAKVLFTVLKSVSLFNSVKVPEEILKAHDFVVAKAGIYTRDIFLLEPETSEQKIFLAHSNVTENAEMHTDNILPVEPGSSNQDLLRYPEMKQLNRCRIPLEAIKDKTRAQRPAIADVVFQLKVAMKFQELEDEEDEFYLSGYMKEALSLHTETIR
ncbi:unnamed protein product [Lactuca virosa]|uniref:Uncharacterized protein n=1 Tax=Lactuca virosa TaxID=75947 RepID=A0AAU9NT18_9ASTR|nr:unnamed protein product [Lactuca virosa]